MDSAGVFTIAVSQIPFTVGHAVLADLNGDGNLDAVMGEGVCLNNGNGRFQATATLMAAVENYLSGHLGHAVLVSAGPGVTRTARVSVGNDSPPSLKAATR